MKGGFACRARRPGGGGAFSRRENSKEVKKVELDEMEKCELHALLQKLWDIVADFANFDWQMKIEVLKEIEDWLAKLK